MSRTPANDASSNARKLLTDAADDYAQATASRDAAFRDLADATRQDRATEAREDRRAGR